jgi:septal ring factor EnvC (AmiA/AmiB activator)
MEKSLMRIPLDGNPRITTEFGVPDPNAFFGIHSGIDYAVPDNTPVLAPVSGFVWWSGLSTTGGNMIIIYDGTYFYRLMHNTKLYVSQSAQVTEGQHIADSGHTGLAFGPHVHFDIADAMDIKTLRPAKFTNFINPSALLKGGHGGGEEMINDTDLEFARWNKLAYQVRGRNLSRDEFRASAVGQSWLRAIEILCDDPEAEATTRAQELGFIATLDNWQGQINSLSAEVQKLVLNPTKPQLDAVQTQLTACTHAMSISQQKLDALQKQQSDNETTAKNLFQVVAEMFKRFKS